jgi:hypothetical protein
MNLSKKMREALLSVFNHPKCTGYIQMKTSHALESRGLIYIRPCQTTESGNFPMLMSQLTTKGYEHCLNNCNEKI